MKILKIYCFLIILNQFTFFLLKTKKNNPKIKQRKLGIKDTLKDYAKKGFNKVKSTIVPGALIVKRTKKDVSRPQFNSDRTFDYPILNKLQDEINEQNKINYDLSKEARESFFSLRELMNNVQQRMLKINEIYNNNIQVINEIIKFGIVEGIDKQENLNEKTLEVEKEDKNIDKLVKEEEDLLDSVDDINLL